MIDVIVIVAAVLALGGLIAIIVRKFPTLASIDTKTIPQEQHGELKARLMEERFKRKIIRVTSGFAERAKPVGGATKKVFQSWYHRLLELEQKYRARMASSESLSPAERAKKLQQVDQVVTAADAALDRGDLGKAEQQAIEAIALNPRNPDAYRVLAHIYLEQKDYEHARETLTFLINTLHVEDDELYAELGQVASGEGNLEEAKTDFEKSITLNGQVAGHYLELCQIELQLGDSATAFEHCRKAVELEPNNPKFLDALVETSIVAGKKDWANETLEKLKTVNPENKKLEDMAERIGAMSQARSTKA